MSYIADDSDNIIEGDNLQTVESKTVSIMEESISGVLCWIKNLPKDLEHITLNVNNETVIFKCCDINQDYNRRLITVKSAGVQYTLCEKPRSLNVNLENAVYTDTLNGAKFLNTLQILHSVIRKIPCRENSSSCAVSILKNAAVASDNYVHFVCPMEIELKTRLFMQHPYVKCLIEMVKQCKAEFESDYFNDFKVKVGLLNSDKYAVQIVGESGNSERVYGNMVFPKIENDEQNHKKIISNLGRNS
jgi:hypothetical protein